MMSNEITSLYLFDFDDTLASTANVIRVTKVIDGVKQQQVNLESEEFEQYRQSSEEERENDIIDFSDFDYVTNPVPIENTIKIMNHAYNDPNSKVAIITARPSASKKDISEFLSAHGMNITDNDINTVGDQGGKPVHKLAVAKQYVENYHPKQVHFYDDSQKNNNAIMQLCEEIDERITVYTYGIVSGAPVPDDSCISFDRERLMEVAGIK
jgi:phosphoserine phosphatase